MGEFGQNIKNMSSYLIAIFLIILFAIWVKHIDIGSSWQGAGLINFSLGFVLLAAFLIGQILKIFGLPLISAYIFTGILAGPYISNFLTFETVAQLRLIDDLALSFIALTAGGELHLNDLKKRMSAIALNIVLNILIVVGFVFSFVILTGKHFALMQDLSPVQIIVMAILLGVISVARSPSSAIAIISETRAKGLFTETVLGVTIVTDVLIIIFFTLAVTIGRTLLSGAEMMNYQVFAALFLELGISLLLGALIGKGISFYIDRAGYDTTLFLLFIAFGITKTSLWLGHFMKEHFDVYLHLEPLLICMSAGFTVQNFSKKGFEFMESLERAALPIYVLFFSLTGAALNLEALYLCWTLAICLVGVRAGGIFTAAWLAGVINRDPPVHNRHAWMAYLTQAGVSIGLAQLAQRQFPEIGMYLTTVVLAIISVNQIAGPVTFKMALDKVGEAGKR
jgi:Kef-type K+ transport system membrane component KefB